jgi:hypothetical protein
VEKDLQTRSRTTPLEHVTEIFASGRGQNPATHALSGAGGTVGSGIIGNTGGCSWRLGAPGGPGLGGNSLAEEPLWNAGLLTSDWDFLPDLAGSDWPAAASNESNHKNLKVCCCQKRTVGGRVRWDRGVGAGVAEYSWSMTIWNRVVKRERGNYPGDLRSEFC